MSTRELIETAIEHCGSEAKLGEATGYSQHGIWRAKMKGMVSAELALAIHRATQGKVSASTLRPDLWASPNDVPESPSASPQEGEGDRASEQEGTAA